jgi:hypothetical protein
MGWFLWVNEGKETRFAGGMGVMLVFIERSRRYFINANNEHETSSSSWLFNFSHGVSLNLSQKSHAKGFSILRAVINQTENPGFLRGFRGYLAVR